MRYTAVVTKEGKQTLAEFPGCPGCQTFADPGEDIAERAGEALAGWLEAQLVSGQAPPEPKKLRLVFERHGFDLVEQHRATYGAAEDARARSDASGETTALPSEEIRLEAVLDCLDLELLERRDGSLRERFVGEVGERRAAP